jgi:hypothetical protein
VWPKNIGVKAPLKALGSFYIVRDGWVAQNEISRRSGLFVIVCIDGSIPGNGLLQLFVQKVAELIVDFNNVLQSAIRDRADAVTKVNGVV